MTSNLNPRVRIPASAKQGEVVEVRTLVQHPMESGQRKDERGNLVARKIVNRFTCSFNGRVVLDAKLEPAIAANPYLVFHVRARESGEFEFVWTDDDGASTRHTQKLAVT
jgi:sulfur-oxidizing protein SoxZ